jgi:N-acylneuraminate cytidylyltransferase
MKIIAFIPVRGGSKSIPLKNIKFLCGKPLVYWSLSALEKTRAIDKIIVATDSDMIERVVLSFNYPKTEIYRRSVENASDVATTESVMLEYIEQSNLAADDIFILVQATSPLTESQHFSEALEMYHLGQYDSLLTCVRNYRFFWNKNGTSINYDYQQRPRRQDFDGQLMENGAFYINTVGNIKLSKNRLNGKIGIYIMPDHTAVEFDEPDDWIVLERLMEKHFLSSKPKKEIKLFLTDVDGVLTDGGMYYSEAGDELKKFNTRDGMAFKLLREMGIKTGIITSEHTKIVEDRAKKLQIDYVVQGERDSGKLTAAQTICNKLGISLLETAYIGDDINCVELLSAVGLAACPADAEIAIKQIPNILHLQKNGGGGCVRELVNIIFKIDAIKDEIHKTDI